MLAGLASCMLIHFSGILSTKASGVGTCYQLLKQIC